MGEVPVRDLRNKSADLLRRVALGERVTVTRDGQPIASVVPLRRAPVGLAELMRRRQTLPPLDPDVLRRDVDDVANPSL